MPRGSWRQIDASATFKNVLSNDLTLLTHILLSRSAKPEIAQIWESDSANRYLQASFGKKTFFQADDHDKT